MGMVVSVKLRCLGQESYKTKLGQETGSGKARENFEDIEKKKGFAVGMTE
jgi:hypothetical protein